MILTILKIIGTILLILIGILIIFVVAVLCMPIHYGLQGQYVEKADFDLKVSWMPVLFKLTASYHNDTFLYVIKLLGGIVMTNTGAKLSYLGKKFFSEKEDAEDEMVEEPLKPTDRTADFRKEDNLPQTGEQLKEDFGDKTKENTVPKFKKKTSWIENIRNKIKEFKRKIRQFIENLKKINEKREDLLKVYRGKRFEIAKKDVILYIKKLFDIVKPDKLEGRLRFGLNDPAATGEVFGILAWFLPLYDGYFILQPEFETSCIEGNIHGKGKFSLFPIIILALKVYFNKNLIKVVKRVQTIIER